VKDAERDSMLERLDPVKHQLARGHTLEDLETIAGKFLTIAGKFVYFQVSDDNKVTELITIRAFMLVELVRHNAYDTSDCVQRDPQK
jgi:hypothetical protein